MQANSKLLSSEWNMFFSCLSKILPNLICSRRLLLSRCCRLFRMRKLVMCFVVMSQVLLVLEHLVAVLAFKCVVVLKGAMVHTLDIWHQEQTKQGICRKKPCDVVRGVLDVISSQRWFRRKSSDKPFFHVGPGGLLMCKKFYEKWLIYWYVWSILSSQRKPCIVRCFLFP